MLVTDPAAPAIRPTDDVDCIVEVATRSEYDGRIRNLLIRSTQKGLSVTTD